MDFNYSDSLTHLMGHVIKLHRQSVDLLIQEHDVYPGQPPLLLRLAEQDGQSQKELANKLQVTPATLTVMVNRMQRTGLVIRKPDPVDQRVSRVFLTAKGHQAIDAVKEALQRIECKCLENFSLEEKLLFRRLLWQMHENLQAFKRENT
jgi:DNA-binding MarR family transcriptional regulator